MENFVEKNTIYRTIVGSTCYGLNTPESDIDIKGICIPPKEYYFGLKTFEQDESGGKDHVIYSIKKFINMAKDCNPNIIEMLYVDNKFIQHITNEGLILRENRHLFLSKKAKYTFSGYAYAQLKRIKNHRKWIMFNEPEPKPEDYMCVKTRPDSTGKTMKYDHFKEEEYKKAKKKYDQYLHWKKNRNPERAILEEKYGYDCKHGMHLIRLLKMGIEILNEGKVNVFRSDDREELLGIRNGDMKYDDLIQYAEKLYTEIDTNEIYNNSPLPKTADYNKIDELLQSITEDFLNG